MTSLHLVANEVLFTSYGHLQLVYDPDGVFGSGDELELEVQGPFLAIGDWDVRPVQPHEIPFAADSIAQRLDLPTDRDASDVWEVLVNLRDFLATQAIEYRLGLFGAVEGQNSNSYIATLAHVVGLDLAPAMAAILGSPDFSSFPGLARNVLFDHVDSDDMSLPPVALVLDGSDGADTLSGGLGNDSLHAGGGRDLVLGLAGADNLSGGSGRDTLRGGEGHDLLSGNGGRDRLFGDAGDDILTGNGKNDRLAGGAGRDILDGGDGDDTLLGNGGADTLSGGRGSDILNGGGGADNLSGQDGSDMVIGNTGNDLLSGGAGADVFVFDGTRNEGRDRISDFADGFDILRVQGLTFAEVSISGTADAIITLGGLTQITLTDVPSSAITGADFDFI
ncbi:calcium-binding protein [Sedimentitalea sp. JM2-8]|uniref:Calcium-binding protein n=1 Tax=Sedimentitalea xiamensis TaxID=3050037 RepID=A0ABT7FDH3_9RHOB|nr:calcium-binding protein [Sedimentitalea xiamensis]MDK3073164.1 calcium-binding protein [Sedimentitalea xiamensis]